MIPQMIYIAISLLGLGISIAEHGKPKTGTNNALAYFIGIVIIYAILGFGGFFDCFLE